MQDKKIFITLSLIFCFTFFIFNFIECSTGSTGWIIFRKAQSPKPRSITSVVAIRGDLSGVLYNPSVLATVQQKEIFTIVELGITEDKVAGVIYAHPFNDSAISVALLNYDAGKMTLYWIEGGQEKEREVTAQNDLLGMFSYGRKFTEKLNIGITAKFATSNIAETATANAFAIDLAASYVLTEKFVVSLAGQNFGTTTKYFDREEKLPTSIWFALGYTTTLAKQLNFCAGVDVPYIIDEGRVTPSIGIEVAKHPVGVFFGYRLNVEESIFNIGLSISIKRFDLSYAFLPSKWLNSVHRLSFGFRF